MITFDNIKFDTHPLGGVSGKLFFPGGYGISVVRHDYSYTSKNIDDYEVAILKGDQDNWEICYDTHFTNDVLGYQTKEDINKILSHLIRIH